MQINNQQYSSNNRTNLGLVGSPTYRNKRVVSVQLMSAHRVNSCKKLDSPNKQLHKIRKRSQNTNHLHNLLKPIQILAQMTTLKQQYTNLRVAYKNLMNKQIKNIYIKDDQLKPKQQKSLQNLLHENKQLKNKITFLQSQIQRIKKQSLKLKQISQFKIFQLQQILHEKQTIIHHFQQHVHLHQLSPKKPSIKPQIISHQNNNLDKYSIPAITQSLIMSKFDNSSYISQFVNTSINSTQQQPQLLHSTKQQNILQKKYLNIDETLHQLTNRSKQPKQHQQNIKKKINKKIQINIDQKHKQFINNITQIKSPHQKKNHKLIKSNKIKFKKIDQNNKSYKKKGLGK